MLLHHHPLFVLIQNKGATTSITTRLYNKLDDLLRTSDLALTLSTLLGVFASFRTHFFTFRRKRLSRLYYS